MRFRIALIAIALACSAPELPNTPPAQRAPKASAAVPPQTWSVDLMTFGGFSSHGKGGITIASDGSTSSACRLSPQRFDSLQRAVAEAKPALWSTSYHITGRPHITDQFSYSLRLSMSNVEVTSGWKDDSVGELPADLRRLYDEVWASREELQKNCRSQ